MLIQRASNFTNKLNSMDLPVTVEQMREFEFNTSHRLIQHIFPDLSPEQREFILTGVTPEEWLAVFGEEDEDDKDITDEPAF